MTIFCPSDTNFIRSDEIDNLGLRFTRFLNAEHDKGKYKFSLPKSFKVQEMGKFIKSIHNRQENQILMLSRTYEFKLIEANVDWRLIVGLGGIHVQETGMTLHHVYGIPYIPGSAVKGVLHHWAKENENEENKKQILNIFGSEEVRGNIIFLDAFPDESLTFTTDIMNPHYPDYYGGKKYPTDCQDPTPINFLAIENAKFRFALLAKKSQKEDLEQTVEWLKQVFDYKGFGAKTAVGYGYFSNDKDVTKKVKDEFDKAEKAKAFSQMSPIDQLCAELKDIKDVNRSYDIYNQIINDIQGEDRIKLAKALKAYWKSMDRWEKIKPKQKAKVDRIKQILSEK